MRLEESQTTDSDQPSRSTRNQGLSHDSLGHGEHREFSTTRAVFDACPLGESGNFGQLSKALLLQEEGFASETIKYLPTVDDIAILGVIFVPLVEENYHMISCTLRASSCSATPRNFMSTSFEGYSPDGDAIAMASPECLAARQAFRERLQELKKRQRAEVVGCCD